MTQVRPKGGRRKRRRTGREDCTETCIFPEISLSLYSKSPNHLNFIKKRGEA